MFNRAELKELAKSQLRGKWGSGVLITFVYLLVCIGLSLLGFIPVLGGIASTIVTFVVEVGLIIAYLNFVKGGTKLEVGDLFKGFENFGKSLGIMCWTTLWLILWLFVFIIPMFIKALAYSQAVYIIANNPNGDVRAALKTSIKMTDGYKWKIFVMGLSFLGWALLCALTLGIGYLWLVPYMSTAFANLFFKLKQLSIEKGVCTEEDFGGIQAAQPAPPVTPAGF